MARSFTVDPRPIWVRKAARSTREQSGLLFTKSSARFASNHLTSASLTDRMYSRLSASSVAWSVAISAPREVGGDAEPSSVPTLPDVGVTSPAVAAVRPRVLEACVDQGDVARALDAHLRGTEVREGMGPSDAGQEALLVDEGAVGVGRAVVLGQVLRVPRHVGLFRREEISLGQEIGRAHV